MEASALVVRGIELGFSWPRTRRWLEDSGFGTVGGALRGIIVLFWKQMHLQYEVGSCRAELRVVRIAKRSRRMELEVAGRIASGTACSDHSRDLEPCLSTRRGGRVVTTVYHFTKSLF